MSIIKAYLEHLLVILHRKIDNIKMCIRDVDVSLCPVHSAGSVTAVVNSEKLANSLEHTYF
jgi:hypothetical protein